MLCGKRPLASQLDGIADHCTLWWDRLWDRDWSHCCFNHDVAWAELQAFAESNWTLAECVNGVLPGMGWIMLCGVSSIVGFAIWLGAHVKAWWRRRKAMQRAFPDLPRE